MYNENPRNDKQMDFAIDNKVPFIIYIGENEVKENNLKVKVIIKNKINFFISSVLLIEKNLYSIELTSLRNLISLDEIKLFMKLLIPIITKNKYFYLKNL